MKKTTQLAAFKLSVLSTLMLCITANNYASDTEIYIPPGDSDKRAKVMFVLDVSTYTFQNPENSSGSQVQPIQYDYDLGNRCDGPTGAPNNLKSFAERRYAGTDYEYTAYYCETPRVNASAAALRGCYDATSRATAISDSPADPPIASDKLRCYDRLSILKQSLTAVINNSRFWAAETSTDTSKPNVSIGFSFFPTQNLFGPPMAPRLLNAAGRDALKKRISGLTYGTAMSTSRIDAGLGLPFPDTNNSGQKAQVTKAYGRGVQQLISSAQADTTVNAKCSGYGVYTLTAGIPDNDEIKVSGGGRELLTNTLDAVTRSNNPLMTATACGLATETSDSNTSSESYKSWRCIEKAAELLYKKQNVLGVPIYTSVVSLGKEFAFYRAADGSAAGDFKPYVSDAVSTDANPETTLATVESRYNQIAATTNNNDMPVLENRRYAIRAGVAGKGGYFAVANAAELQSNIERFLDSMGEVDIPYLTTGAPVIPQDPLNPALVQSDAYYSQFKPTPNRNASKRNQLWAGNLKKYDLTSAGILKGKSNAAVLDSIGKFVETTHDFWAPDVSSTDSIRVADENTWGSELYARMGGIRSQLPLSTTVVDGVTLSNRLILTNRQVTNTNGSVSVSESTTLRPINLNYTQDDPKRADLMKLLELRQIGAVMHSSPLLLSNKGQITYNANTQALAVSNRSDYVLFGTTQGILHVVKADDYTSTNGGGKEVFAFVPHEMIERQSKAFLSAGVMKGGEFYYGIDAPWTAYTEYVPDSDDNLTVGRGKPAGENQYLNGKQFVYGGLRMGGKSYYSLDLSNLDSIDTNRPTLKFHINPTGTGSLSNPLGYMGQSWSKPKIAWVKWKGVRKLVMFVGGGYDTGYESDTYDPNIAQGAGVYMFSADGDDAGSLLWWASANASSTTTVTDNTDQTRLYDPNLRYSVVSDIKTADRDNDGLVDHLYFGDLGGQVFRVDLNNQAVTSGGFASRSTRILNLHRNNGESPRFYAAPSFAVFEDVTSGTLFAAISIGSGNLSRPLIDYPSTSSRDYDALYTIYDKDVARSDLYTTSTMRTQDITLNTTVTNDVSKLNEITTADRFRQTAVSTGSSQPLNPIASYSGTAGWFFKFKAIDGTGRIQQEKVFYTPSVLDHDLYISTYDPSELALRGECGGGVKGTSSVRLFCMPYGQCSTDRSETFTTEANASDKLGAGIIDHAVAGSGNGRFVHIPSPSNLLDRYNSPVKLIAQRWYER